jgi:hypothetical protein
MSTVKELEEQNAALRQQLFDREIADQQAKAERREAEQQQAEARDSAERAAEQAAAVEKVRVGAWTLHLLDQQIATGQGRAAFAPSVPPSGWPPGQSPENFGIGPASPHVADDVSNSPIFKRIAAKRGGKL